MSEPGQIRSGSIRRSFDSLAARIRPVHFRAIRDSAQSITTGTITLMTWTTVTEQKPTPFDFGTLGRITIPTGLEGWYTAQGRASLSGAYDLCRTKFNVNDGTTPTADVDRPAAGSSSVPRWGFGAVYFNAGGWVEFYIRQSTGGSLNVNNANWWLKRIP